MALIGQILYLMKRSFASHNLFDGYTAFIVFRIVVILVLSIVFFVKNLISHEVNTAELDGRSEKSKIQCQGLILYLSYPFMLWFGFYRLFSVKDFTAVVFTSYCLELVFQSVPLVFIQGINNGIMQDSGLDPKPIVGYSMGLTIVVVIELFL